MDPDSTLRDMLAALKRRDWECVEELANSLLDWMENRRGFPPLTLGPKDMGKEWHRTIAHMTCLAALSRVREAKKRRERRKSH